MNIPAKRVCMQKNEYPCKESLYAKDEYPCKESLYAKDEYPCKESMEFHQAEIDRPESLKQFLDLVIPGKKEQVKSISIPQPIMLSAFPRKLIIPMQSGLAVHLHDHFASKYLIDIFHSMGFTKSYAEVRKYEMNAALIFDDHDLKIENTQNICFMADNVDHNPCNLYGRNTVHWMGMSLAVAPVLSDNQRVIPRSEVSNDQITGLTSDMVQSFNAEGV